MSRTLTSGVADAVAAPTYREVGFVKLEFDAGPVRLNTSPYDLAFDPGDGNGDETFNGVGSLGRIGTIEEAAEPQAYAVDLELTGVDLDNVAIALNIGYQGRTARIWTGFLDADHVLIPVPVRLWKGPMDQMPVRLGAEATVGLTIGNVFARWEKPQVRRVTNEDQQHAFAGDKFNEFDFQLAEKQIDWGWNR